MRDEGHQPGCWNLSGSQSSEHRTAAIIAYREERVVVFESRHVDVVNGNKCLKASEEIEVLMRGETKAKDLKARYIANVSGFECLPSIWNT
jgi:hypothetical protein